MRTIRNEGIDPHDITERHPGCGQDLADRPEAEIGLLPGKYFFYPNSDPNEPLWWGIYWGATGIHATHVAVGMGLFVWLYLRTLKGHFGPKHYNAVEGVGLYWHIVDIVWIFLFPLLYLIH